MPVQSEDDRKSRSLPRPSDALSAFRRVVMPKLEPFEVEHLLLRVGSSEMASGGSPKPGNADCQRVTGTGHSHMHQKKYPTARQRRVAPHVEPLDDRTLLSGTIVEKWIPVVDNARIFIEGYTDTGRADDNVSGLSPGDWVKVSALLKQGQAGRARLR